MDAMKLLEGRRRGAEDPDVEHAYARALMELGLADRARARDDEALVWFKRALEVLEGLAHEPQDFQVIFSIDHSRRAIAGLCRRRGLDEERRRVLESHIRILERLSERAGSDPEIGLLAALGAGSPGPRSERGAAKLSAAIERSPSESDGSCKSVGGSRRDLDCPRCPAISVRPEFQRQTAGAPRPGRPRPCGHPPLESRCERWKRLPRLAPRRGNAGVQHCRRSSLGATIGWPPGRCPLDRRISLRLGEDAGAKRSQRSGVPCVAVRSLRAGSEKRLEGRGLPHDRSGDAKRAGRGLYRVTSRPPGHGCANEGRVGLQAKIFGLGSW